MNINAPKLIKNLLATFSKLIQDYFRENLIGIYLHGSLAMGCYNSNSSDIDVVVVVKNKLTIRQKNDLFTLMLGLENQTQSAGFELSIVTESEVRNFQYPTPFEFHFHRDHIKEWVDRKINKKTIENDYDLAAHFTVIKNQGATLFGKPIKNLFPAVPKKDYLNSISRDAEWSYRNFTKETQSGKCRVPVYGVLNFCRVLAFIRDDLITSKLEGGEWGIENLPDKFCTLISEAVKEYKLSGTAQDVDANNIREFAEYAFGEIKKSLT
ncbi:MAG: aminoglycoside adenylyltransferase domain-containing protein [Patescibacteria group bacterium]